MVLRLLLHTPSGLLRATTAARSDGHRRRCQSATMDVHRYLRHAARGAAALRCAGLESDAGTLHPGSLPLFRRQSRPVLATADRGRRDGYRGARLLCLGQRVQPLCRRGVLVVHGRSLHQRAGQAPVRIHRRRGDGRFVGGSSGHDRPFGTARPDQPADRGNRLSRTSGVVRSPARA